MGALQGLSIKEGQALAQRNNEADEAVARTGEGSSNTTVQLRQQASPTCSNCNTRGHTSVRCPIYYSN